mmetsp:Transcript_100025/g.283144  ORF Transcript_100025/g.283144 Transcript_100025/m.283144 type:complete len:496 (-) Transcript_100025:248-1735(-)
MGSCYSMTAQQTMVFEPVLSRDLSADRMPSIGKEPSIRRRHFIIDRTGMISDTYALEEDKLGEGSYGSVSRATHKATDMVRAIKTIPKERLRSTDRVKREIAIMKLIDHPGIIKLHETFADDDNIYLCMELCTGGELFGRIVQEGRFSESAAAGVMQQVLRSICYMHKTGICHRDLKPENFLLQTKDPINQNVVKIIDFGLSSQFEIGTPMKTRAGSPVYVAPEVLNGKGYDSQCDIWSIGGTAFVLACGHVPFTGKTEKSVLDKVARGIPCFLPAHWRRVPAHAKAFVQTLLTKSPERRPTAALALADEWLTAAAGPGARGLPRGFVENLRRFKSEDTFSKAVRHVVAGVLDDPDVRALRSAFVALDLDGNGLLSPRELQEGLRRSGLSISEQELLEILEGMDVNGNGAIEYTEFLAAAVDTSKCRGEGMCQYAFDVFDWDGDGQISLQDLRNVVRHRRLSDEVGAECQAIVQSLPNVTGSNLCLKDFKAILDL